MTDRLVKLAMDNQEAHDLHHAISVTVQLLQQAGVQPGAPLTPESEERLVAVARRLDHERRWHGAVPNPHAVRKGA